MRNTTADSGRHEGYDAGVAGMILVILALGAEELLAAVDMHAPAGQNLKFYPDAGINANPRISAKVVWAQAVKDLRMVTSMALARILCQNIANHNSGLNSSTIEVLRKSVSSMAAESCALDKDESDALFDSCLSYVERIFLHPHVRECVVPFGKFLKRNGVTGKSEIIEYLETVGLAR